MPQELKQKIIEILYSEDRWEGKTEELADQILSLFEAEKQKWVEGEKASKKQKVLHNWVGKRMRKPLKALDLEVKDMPAFPPKGTDLITLAIKIGMAKKMAEKIGEIEKEKRQQSTKPSIDELGRPNLTPTEIIERAEIRGFNQALETAIKILKK